MDTEKTEQWRFGFGQIPKTTPEFAKWIFRIVLYATSVINLVISVVTEIPPDIKMMMAKYSLYAVTMVHGFTKLFGLQDDYRDKNSHNAIN